MTTSASMTAAILDRLQDLRGQAAEISALLAAEPCLGAQDLARLFVCIDSTARDLERAVERLAHAHDPGGSG